MIDKINGNDVYGYADQNKRKNPAVKAYENTPGQKDAAGRKTGQKRGTKNMLAADKGTQGVILDLSNQPGKEETKAAQAESSFSLPQAVRKLFEPILRWLKNFWESDASSQAAGHKEQTQSGQAAGQMDGTASSRAAESPDEVKSGDMNVPAAQNQRLAAAETINQAAGMEGAEAVSEPDAGSAFAAEQQSVMEGVLAEQQSVMGGSLAGQQSVTGNSSIEQLSDTERIVSSLLSGTERTVSDLLSSTERAALDHAADTGRLSAGRAAGSDNTAAEQIVYEILESSPMEEDAEGLPPLEDISDLPKYGAISDEALKSGSLEQIEQLLTRNGTRHLAHNSDLLTYYDRWGRLIELDETQRHRVLFGDKNVMKL